MFWNWQIIPTKETMDKRIIAGLVMQGVVIGLLVAYIIITLVK